MITAQPVAILQDNYAWLLRDSATGATAIVDPAEPGAGRRGDRCRRRAARPDPADPSPRRPHRRHRRHPRPLRRPRGRRPRRRAPAAPARPGGGRGRQRGARRVGGTGDRHAGPHARPDRVLFPRWRRADLRRHAVQPGLRAAAGRHRGGDVRLAAHSWRPCRRRRWCAAATNTPRATRGSRCMPIPATRPCRPMPRTSSACARRAGRACRAACADELAANPFLRAPDVASFADLRARKDKF